MNKFHIFLFLMVTIILGEGLLLAKPLKTVTVISALDAVLEWKISYHPSDKLPISGESQQKIAKILSELNQKIKTGNYPFFLTHVRLVNNQLQAILVSNDLGDTYYYDLADNFPQRTCEISMSGNGDSSCY